MRESDVHSDIYINAFLMTAFCLPNHNMKVKLFQKFKNTRVPRAKNSPGWGDVSCGCWKGPYHVALSIITYSPIVGAQDRFGWTVQAREMLSVSESSGTTS